MQYLTHMCIYTNKHLIIWNMKRINILLLLLIGFSASAFWGCSEDNVPKGVTEYDITVASEKVVGIFPYVNGHLEKLYAVKRDGSSTWTSLREITGFAYENGYEYKLHIKAIPYTEASIDECDLTEYRLLRVKSKKKRDTKGLPQLLIAESYYSNYKTEVEYVVDADNKKEIEDDLRSEGQKVSRIPYILNNQSWLFKDKSNKIADFGDISIDYHRITSEFPAYCKDLLPPNYELAWCEKWSFVSLNKPGTIFNSYDVLKCDDNNGHYYLYLCDNLTTYFSQIYPEAGVKRVVVIQKVKCKY